MPETKWTAWIQRQPAKNHLGRCSGKIMGQGPFSTRGRDSWGKAGRKKLKRMEKRRSRREGLNRDCATTEPGMKKSTSTVKLSKGVLRAVMVVGDGKVGRFAKILVQKVGIPDSVEFL